MAEPIYKDNIEIQGEHELNQTVPLYSVLSVPSHYCFWAIIL